MIRKSVTLLLVLSLITPMVLAKGLKIHGFVAQGITLVEGSNFVDEEQDLNFKLTELGVNASYRINEKFRLSGQGVYLNGGNRYPEGVRIDYMFLEWQLYQNLNWNIKAQIGRNKNYHWLYSSTRDVPHTRPSIILPQSVYFDAFRDVALGVDGLVIVGQTHNRMGEWDLNFSYGKSKVSEQEKLNLLGDAAIGDLSHEKDLQFSVYFRPRLSAWQWGINLLDADFQYTRLAQEPFFDGDETSQRIMLNALYQVEKWELAAEILRERVIVDGIVAPSFESDVTAEGGFFQVRYLFDPSLSFMARLDLYDKDRKDRAGDILYYLSHGQNPRYFSYMDQGSVGVTWQFAKNMQVQAEFHRTKGGGRLAPVFTPDTQVNDSKYWNMWAVQLMYWF